MNKKILSDIKDKIYRNLEEHRLRDAYSLARSLAETMMDFESSDRLIRHEETYRQMLHYAMEGAEDPGREQMVLTLADEVRTVVDSLDRKNRMPDEPSLYYNVARFEATRQAEDIPFLLAEYAKELSHSSFFNLVTSDAQQEKVRNVLVHRQELERRLFNKIWTTYPLRPADYSAVSSILQDKDVPDYFKVLCVWALLLGQLFFFDATRLQLLAESFINGSDKVKAASAVALLLGLSAARNRRLPDKVTNRLAAAAETEHWNSYVELAYKELVRTRDTDRITAKIRDEVVPEMMKLRPEISRRFSGELPVDPEDMEENPRWQELLENSGVADKLKEMSEIQEEGGDVMMGTFSHLKSFPFFHEVANWFLPFHTERSEFESRDSEPLKVMADILAAMPMLCDSDKYSMLLSLQAAPEAQRNMLLAQINAQAAQFAEVRSAMLNNDRTDCRELIRRQVQNLFRFFRLFRRKGEFPNPFEAGIDPSGVQFLAPLASPEVALVVAEFYFTHGYWLDGLRVTRNISGLKAAASVPDSPEYLIYQRMAFAAMKAGLYDEALEYFSHLLMITPENPWVLKNIARCHIHCGDFEAAATELRRLTGVSGFENDAPTALLLGNCYLELEEYDKAVKSYFKAEYLGASPKKVLRRLSWALLMNGNAEQGERYLRRAMETTGAIPNDYLNLGHIALAQGNIREAINDYRLNVLTRTEQSGTLMPDAREAFIKEIYEDSRELSHIGIDSSLLPLIIDALFYTI